MIAWDGEETRFLKVITIFFNIEEMDSVFSLSHQWAWRNRKLKWIKTDGIDYPLMRFQFWNMFEDPELGLKGSSLWVYLVVVNQGCCRSSQYNLLDRSLQLDANIIMNQIYVLFTTLVNFTFLSRDQYLPSIHSWDSGSWKVLYIPLLLFFQLLLWIVFHVGVVTFNKINFVPIYLTSFLFNSKLFNKNTWVKNQ